MIKTARVIEDKSSEDEAGIGKTITIYIPEDDEEEVYTIVSTVRQDSLNGLISVESPLGKALLRHRVGDTVMIRVSDSYSYEAQIRNIRPAENTDDLQLNRF